jgi:thioredoxin 1
MSRLRHTISYRWITETLVCDNVTEEQKGSGYTKTKIKKGMVIKMSAIGLNRNNFEEVVLGSGKTVLIDCWAPWCGPCRMQSPIIEELADELKGSAVVAKLNVDDNPELAAQFSVMSIPTLVFIKDGKVVSSRTGVTPKATLLSVLDSVKA